MQNSTMYLLDQKEYLSEKSKENKITIKIDSFINLFFSLLWYNIVDYWVFAS